MSRLKMNGVAFNMNYFCSTILEFIKILEKDAKFRGLEMNVAFILSALENAGISVYSKSSNGIMTQEEMLVAAKIIDKLDKDILYVSKELASEPEKISIGSVVYDDLSKDTLFDFICSEKIFISEINMGIGFHDIIESDFRHFVRYNCEADHSIAKFTKNVLYEDLYRHSLQTTIYARVYCKLRETYYRWIKKAYDMDINFNSDSDIESAYERLKF